MPAICQQGHGAEQVRNQAADEQANDDFIVVQVEYRVEVRAFQCVRVIGKQNQRSPTGRADSVAFPNSFGRIANSAALIGNAPDVRRQLKHLGQSLVLLRQ